MGSIAKQENHQSLTHRQHGGKSKDMAVDQTKLLWNQEAAILDATELLCQLMKEAGISRSDLAARMGTTKSNITQILDGSRNMTIRTLSDVMTYLGHEFRASCKSRQTKDQPHVVVRVVAEFLISMADSSPAFDSVNQNIEFQQLDDFPVRQSRPASREAVQLVGA